MIKRIDRDGRRAMTLNEVQQLAAKIDGWLSPREGALLYRLAKDCRPGGVIVELGSWKGRSTVCLGHGSRSGAGAMVYAIDPHTGSEEHRSNTNEVWTFDEFQTNIRAAGLQDIVTPIVAPSEKVAATFNQPIALIFIDADHGYDAVRRDFELWFPKVMDGGIMAFHDTIAWEGPKRAVQEVIFGSRAFRNAGFVDSIVFAEKVAANGWRDRARNRYVAGLKSLYEVALPVRVPRPIRRAGARLLLGAQ